MCFATVESVLQSRRHQSATCANEVQIFCPFTMKCSPSSTAFVCTFARSLPAFGSLNPWHHTSLMSRIFGRYRFFCSSLPCAMIVGPARLIPTKLMKIWGARAAAISSWKMICSISVVPRPP